MLLNTIFALILVNLFWNSTTKALQYNKDQESFSGKEEILNLISDISSQLVCVFSDDKTKDDVDLINKHLMLNNKAIVNMELCKQNTFVEECFYNLYVLDDLEDCNELRLHDFNYTDAYSFYILVVGKWGFSDKGFCSEQFGSSRVVLVYLRESLVFSLSSSLLPPRKFVQSDLLSIGEDRGSKSLEGREVNVATFNCSPFVIFDNNSSQENITGIEWELLREISNLLHFKIKLVELKGKGEWGAVINGSWNGGIGLAVAEGAADIGICNIWNSWRFYSIMDFGPSNNLVTFTFIVPRPRLFTHQWHSLVNIFAPRVWFYTFIMYLLYTIFYWICCNVLQRAQHRIGIGESVLTMFGILMLTSWTARTTTFSTRQMVVQWLVFVLILTTVFSSSIVAKLSLPGFETRIDTVRQLVEKDFHWFDKNYTAHDKQSIYFNLANHWQREWEKRYQHIHTRDIVAAINSRTFAFPIQRWRRNLVVFSQVGLDYDRDLVNMRVLKETTSFVYVSFGFAKRSPLYKMCRRSLQQLYEHGVTNYWATKIIRERGSTYSRQLLQERDVVEAKLQKLTIANLKPAFYILLSGLFVSCFIFLGEIMHPKICRAEYLEENRIPFLN